MVGKVLEIYKSVGIKGLTKIIYRRVFPKRAKSFPLCKQIISGRKGLEIGGLSSVFQRKTGILPIYPLVKKLDNCNFSGTTIWEEEISEGQTFQYDDKQSPGNQYISEATDLSMIDSSQYDFVLSSHVIEHIANPLQALSEWLRVLKKEGYMILLIPDKEGTFDHRRKVTSLEHLIEDFENETKEDDLTHLPEILEFHDLERSPEISDFAEFKARSEKNFENRGLHHHVFDKELVVQLLSHLNLKILAIEKVKPFHIIAVVQKVS